jgi:hypothetical protein
MQPLLKVARYLVSDSDGFIWTMEYRNMHACNQVVQQSSHMVNAPVTRIETSPESRMVIWF